MNPVMDAVLLSRLVVPLKTALVAEVPEATVEEVIVESDPLVPTTASPVSAVLPDVVPDVVSVSVCPLIETVETRDEAVPDALHVTGSELLIAETETLRLPVLLVELPEPVRLVLDDTV